jgi:hypothetical protein
MYNYGFHLFQVFQGQSQHASGGAYQQQQISIVLSASHTNLATAFKYDRFKFFQLVVSAEL